MYNHISERSGLKAPLISDEVYVIIMKVSFLFDDSVVLIVFLFSRINARIHYLSFCVEACLLLHKSVFIKKVFD